MEFLPRKETKKDSENPVAN